MCDAIRSATKDTSIPTTPPLARPRLQSHRQNHSRCQQACERGWTGGGTLLHTPHPTHIVPGIHVCSRRHQCSDYRCAPIHSCPDKTSTAALSSYMHRGGHRSRACSMARGGCSRREGRADNTLDSPLRAALRRGGKVGQNMAKNKHARNRSSLVW